MEPREIELKLEFNLGDAERVLSHPLLAEIPESSRRRSALQAVYYDTPGRDLHKAGISLRIRRDGDRTIQTVKADSGTGGIALDRQEWEYPVEDGIDFKAAAGTPLDDVLSGKKLRRAVAPAFTVETDRQAYEIHRDGATIELAVDQSKVTAGKSSLDFGEVELELKKGPPAALFTVAREMSLTIPLRLTRTAKSQRGYGLLGFESGSVSARRTKLPRRATSAEAFQIIARSCLSQMIRNEALLRANPAPEPLHQMRVGLRRLRAAMSSFKAMLADRESQSVKADLRWVSGLLGAARDLDVLIERLRQQDAVEDRVNDAEQRRSEAYETLLAALNGPRFVHIMLRTAAWVETGRWLTRDTPALQAQRSQSAKALAGDDMARRWKRIRRRSKHVAGLEDGARHQLRIQTKKLRFGIEFFGTLYKGKKAKRRRSALSPLLERFQDVLGEMHDIFVSGSLLASTPIEERGAAERRMEKLAGQATSTARKLNGTKVFWI